MSLNYIKKIMLIMNRKYENVMLRDVRFEGKSRQLTEISFTVTTFTTE